MDEVSSALANPTKTNWNKKSNAFKAKCIAEGLTKIKTFMVMEYDYLLSKSYILLDNGLMVKK